jgi:hypothetical protein
LLGFSSNRKWIDEFLSTSFKNIYQLISGTMAGSLVERTKMEDWAQTRDYLSAWSHGC